MGLDCSEGEGVAGALIEFGLTQPWFVLVQRASFQQGLLGPEGTDT